MKEVDKQDKCIPRDIEQLIEYYDLENLWPTIEELNRKINKKEG